MKSCPPVPPAAEALPGLPPAAFLASVRDTAAPELTTGTAFPPEARPRDSASAPPEQPPRG